jgi:putative ABC transport system ATP-binding protein
MKVIDLRSLSKESSSIQNLDLELRRGEVVSLRAAAGAEAPRLARILSLDEHGWAGEFFLLGAAIHDLDTAARREIRRASLGVVLCEERLIPELTVFENLELPLTLRTRRAERDAVIDPILELLDVSELRDCYPRALSRRETQLVRIARAVVGGPAALIADDLSSALRPTDWARVNLVLRGLLSRGTAIAVTRTEEFHALVGTSGLPRRGLDRLPVEDSGGWPLAAAN